ncbi:MAG: asparagine synthase (glutamine-hydrolyzing) [Chlamydiae bacterium]|nr:asparagine synthase (glutamine-hydrolyzing) [Chlamydiota bacterium]MBI3276194.1 asparagine synthase (glutamine-hydrolyzing) [Chlamydiota bacterium]
MCGITGIVNSGGKETLQCMTNMLRHRGPDDRGLEFFPELKVGLGHQRLSILDLSPLGHQPMSDETGQFWIVYNGEIYNFVELRHQLEMQGHRFQSRTDTEVLLRLYQERAKDFVQDLNGMFAFAILDRKKQRLILARDRLGVKPLYYYHHEGHFVFASEIKAILASGVYSPDIHWQGLYDYLTYLYVPCPDTLFKDIHQVPPAHVVVLDLKSNQLAFDCYWDLADFHTHETNLSFEDQEDRLRSLLEDSVHRQMVSDVPLGVFLSGGVDSPILTGLMAKHSTRPVKTFTIIFKGAGLDFYNEQEEAKIVSDFFKTEHHEIPVDISSPSSLLELVHFFDQPFGNPTSYLMYLISKETRREVTVALSGAGGDELFGGYPRYRAALIAQSLRMFPPAIFKGIGSLLSLFPDQHRTMNLRRVREFFAGFDKDFVRQFLNWAYFFDKGEKQKLLNHSQFLPSDRILRKYFQESSADFGNRMLEVDLQTFLVDNILEYTDKMSMAVGLEVRVPYLDHRLVEMSLQIPSFQKMNRKEGKIVLKKAFRDLLPKKLLERKKKGFNAPLVFWMKKLDAYFDHSMTQASVKKEGIFNWEYIQQLRSSHKRGKADYSYELFSLIMFDVWYHEYILRDFSSIEFKL